MANMRETAVQGQQVSLKIQFLDASGEAVDPVTTPELSILDSNSVEVLAQTSNDVLRLDIGLYEYLFSVPANADLGDWTDIWYAQIEDAILETSFSFSVVTPESSLSATTGPGKIKIGDSVIFNFTDEEIYGINICLSLLKPRLRSSGKKPKRDQFGAFVYDGYGELILDECNVFDDEILVAFLCQSLSEFNSTPFFTAYTFADPLIQNLFSSIIVEGAYVFALASQSIVEKGRDFTISDGGISYQPPQLGEYLQSHYSTWLSSYRERLKFIKNNIRPGPRSFGTYSNITSNAPAFTRLRHLRSRRIT